MHRYRELEVWNRSRSFCSQIYRVTENFPNSEKLGLVVQLRRASISVASNIAEGASRSTKPDFRRFLEISIGSAYELETQLLIASDLSFLGDEETTVLLKNLDSIIKMLSKLRSSIG